MQKGLTFGFCVEEMGKEGEVRGGGAHGGVQGTERQALLPEGCVDAGTLGGVSALVF